MARWLPSQKNNMLRHRRVSGGKGDTNVKYRISSMHKMLMLSVAFMMDTIPIIVGFSMLLLPTILGGATGAMAEKSEKVVCDDAQKISNLTINQLGINGYIVARVAGLGAGSACAAAPVVAKAAPLAGMVVNIVLFPKLLAVSNISKWITNMVVVSISAILFFFWFTMRGVWVFGLRTKLVVLNLSTLFIKTIPLIGSFVPAITYATWRHIHLSRQDDKKRAKKQASSQIALA